MTAFPAAAWSRRVLDKGLHPATGEYRYSAQQRRKQMKQKKFHRLLDHKKKSTLTASGRTVKECEAAMCNSSKKSYTLQAFMEYVSARATCWAEVHFFYDMAHPKAPPPVPPPPPPPPKKHKPPKQQRPHEPRRPPKSKPNETCCLPMGRVLRWHSFMNTQKSEANVVNQIQRRYGPPGSVVLALGNFSHGNYHMRGLAPTKGVGMRKVLQRAGHIVLIVDEFRSSKVCHKCHHETENFLRRPSPKPFKPRAPRPVHGLLRCKNAVCRTIWNRYVCYWPRPGLRWSLPRPDGWNCAACFVVQRL